MSGDVSKASGDGLEQRRLLESVPDRVVDARHWEPTRDTEHPKRCCQHCGRPVPKSYRRAFGDSDDVVDACICCTTPGKMSKAAPGVYGDVERDPSTSQFHGGDSDD